MKLNNVGKAIFFLWFFSFFLYSALDIVGISMTVRLLIAIIEGITLGAILAVYGVEESK